MLAKATGTHSHSAFPLHQWLRERVSMLPYTYNPRVVCVISQPSELVRLCRTGAGMVAGEAQSARKKPHASATLPFTYPTWTGSGIEPGFRGERIVDSSLTFRRLTSTIVDVPHR